MDTLSVDANKLSDTQSAIAPAPLKSGDQVLLWRSGPFGGIVGSGKVASINEYEDPRLVSRNRFFADKGRVGWERKNQSLFRALTVFDQLCLSNPIATDVLGSLGFPQIEEATKTSSQGFVPISLSDNQWRVLLEQFYEPRSQEWPLVWDIDPGSVVSRTRLHSFFGGNPRVNSSPSGKTPNIFLFIKRDPRNVDLAPYWDDDDVLVTPGSFQWDEKRISHENIALLTHVWCGRPLRVFETKGGECLYLGEFAVDQYKSIECWPHTGEAREYRRRREERQVPLVRLRLLSGIKLPVEPDSFAAAPRLSLSLQPVTVDRSGDNCNVRNDEKDDREGTKGADSIRKLLEVIKRNPESAKELGELDEAQALAALVQRKRRESDLASLRSVVEDPNSAEPALQKQLERMTWIFGGEFLAEPGRRALTAGDQLDFSLIRPDGSLHGVEIKKANIPRLIKLHRGRLIAWSDINEAVGQAMNYLRSLDEQYHTILNEYKIDCRRASMTVLIGYTPFIDRHSPHDIDETLRTYNSYLSRIEVVTYDQLLDTAQQALDLTETCYFAE